MKTIILSVLLGCAAFTAQSAYLVVGDSSLNFNLMDTDSNYQKLTDYRGKVVLLFTMGYFCGNCVRKGVEFEAFDQAYGNKPVQFLELDLHNGTLSQDRAYKINSGFTFPLVMGGVYLRPYYGSAYNRDVLFIIDGKGKIIYKYDYQNSGAYNFDSLAVSRVVDSALASLGTAAEAVAPIEKTALNVFPNPLVAGMKARMQGLPGSKFQVFDTRGRCVKSLGTEWDGRDNAGKTLAPGLYTLRAGTVTKKMVLLAR